MYCGGRRFESDEVHWVHRQITNNLQEGGEREGCLDLSSACLIQNNEQCSGDDNAIVRCETNELVLRG